MTPTREYTAAVVGCLLGGALVLGATTENWADGEVSSGPGLPMEAVALTSYNVAPAVGGLAVLALAAVAALAATRGTLRRIVGALVLLAGATITVITLRALASAGAAAAAMRQDLADVDLNLRPWPWVAAAGGLLVLAAGLLTVVRGARWPSMSRRYDRPAAETPAADTRNATPEDFWRALDRGDDPTVR